MNAFTTHYGLVAPLPRANIDTDQIIPKQFLKRVERSGFGPALFHDWRFNTQGEEVSDFILNCEPFRGASILLAGPNFGCGSSREHAVWALMDFGFRAIIAESFADIFSANAANNGLLTASVTSAVFRRLTEMLQEDRALKVEVDLPHLTISADTGWQGEFSIDPFRRKLLLEGLDEISATLAHESRIETYERSTPGWR
jgi:3-isopropylmalate/(R)-2-methylmalate dehydratase small subunit